MESSDDNFIWTDASSNSEMALDFNIKNETTLSSGTSKEVLEIDDYLNTRVKQEQESFVETTETISKKKKKHKKNRDLICNGSEEQYSSQLEENGNNSVASNNNFADNQIDNYLNIRVKQEQESFVEPTEIKLKKKKKSKVSLDTSFSDNYDLQSSESVQQKNESESDLDNSVTNHALNIKEEKDVHKKKKKKSKKKQVQVDSEASDNQSSKISEHEMSKDNDDSSKYDRNDDDDDNDMSINEEVNKDIHSESVQKIKNKKVKKRESKTLESSDSDKEVTKQNKSISDRLRFEDEDTTDFTSVQNTFDENWPKQIKKFVKFTKNINHTSLHIQPDHFVSEDDDIWIIKCPHEFDIKDFTNLNLTLDSKCKIKMNGQTYDGALDDSIERVPILTYDDANKKSIVKSVPIMGLMKFRKRIPKPHIPDQGMLASNQNNFIPLPDTKCRHPLFGVNYKKAIKIPSAIAERLNGHNGSIQESLLKETCKPKKKKHKKEKCKMENEYTNDTETIAAEQPVSASKKKRKRKHSDEVDGLHGPSKRIKQDPHSAEAWESEQAIKNNLFGFE